MAKTSSVEKNNRRRKLSAQHAEKRKRLKLDPDLTDGEHRTIHDEPNDVLMSMLRDWMDNAMPGEAIKIELVAMTDEEERALREQLARLLQEHRDLDAAIEALVTSPGSDLIQVQRLDVHREVGEQDVVHLGHRAGERVLELHPDLEFLVVKIDRF